MPNPLIVRLFAFPALPGKGQPDYWLLERRARERSPCGRASAVASGRSRRYNGEALRNCGGWQRSEDSGCNARMLLIGELKGRTCSGMTRRALVQAGFMGALGLTLPQHAALA